MVIGIILVIIGVVFCIVGVIQFAKPNSLAILSGLVLALGLALILTQPKNNDDDKEYTIECSDYKIINQSQMTITGEDTVMYKKYIIKYKK